MGNVQSCIMVFVLRSLIVCSISDVKAIYNEIMNMENIGESVNSMWTYFQNNLDNSIKNNIPHKTAKNKDG
jgi:hypothetical protein